MLTPLLPGRVDAARWLVRRRALMTHGRSTPGTATTRRATILAQQQQSSRLPKRGARELLRAVQRHRSGVEGVTHLTGVQVDVAPEALLRAPAARTIRRSERRESGRNPGRPPVRRPTPRNGDSLVDDVVADLSAARPSKPSPTSADDPTVHLVAILDACGIAPRDVPVLQRHHPGIVDRYPDWPKLRLASPHREVIDAVTTCVYGATCVSS